LSQITNISNKIEKYQNPNFSFLEKINDRSIFFVPSTQIELEQAENELGINFPKDLSTFLTRYGAIGTRSEYNLFGLGCPKSIAPSLIWAKHWLKFLSPNFPDNLLPIGTIDWKVYACLNLNDSNKVIRWYEGKPIGEQDLAEISPTYAEFLLRVSKELYLLDQALITLKNRVHESDDKYHFDLGGKGKLPRNQDFRVHRFCSRDIILGAIALKHQKGVNCLIVDLFLPLNLPPFERDGSLIFMTLFMLGDAYRCGGTMEIRFTENVDGGQVPRKLQALAKQVGAAIKTVSIKNNRLDPDDSTRLYLALTGFSDPVLGHIQKNHINPLKACFVVHRGIWSKSEVEIILVTSVNPNRIFNGGASEIDWCNYQKDLLISRSAILSGYLTRAFTRRSPEDNENGQIDIEDDSNDVSIGILSEHHALVYKVNVPEHLNEKEITIPWLVQGTTPHMKISSGEEFIVLVRARNQAEFISRFEIDIEVAGYLSKKTSKPVFILVPRDFDNLSLDTYRPKWIKDAGDQKIGLIVCGEDVSTLNEEVFRRYRASQIVRD